MTPLPIAVVLPDDHKLWGISERRSIAINRLIAHRLRQDNSGRLINDARINLARMRQRIGKHPDLDRWEQLLDRGAQACAEQLEQATEQGHDMRQNTPFAGVLNTDERHAVLEQVYGHPLD
jgi:hypothetical protein